MIFVQPRQRHNFAFVRQWSWSWRFTPWSGAKKLVRCQGRDVV